MIKIKYYDDSSCEMEQLIVEQNDDQILLGHGNYWDDHCEDRLHAIKKLLDFLEIPYECQRIKSKYNYAEGKFYV